MTDQSGLRIGQSLAQVRPDVVAGFSMTPDQFRQIIREENEAEFFARG